MALTEEEGEDEAQYIYTSGGRRHRQTDPLFSRNHRAKKEGRIFFFLFFYPCGLPLPLLGVSPSLLRFSSSAQALVWPKD